jgi:DNA-binding transcriptional LysR family regulator
MDLRTLRYFISVYEELSLSSAAKRCFVAQPSISTAIRHLEKELDRQLFVRHARGVSPTRAGKELYPYATKVMNDIQRMQELFKEETPHIPLKIGLMPFLSGERIGSIIKKLLEKIPGLDLTIVDWNESADARIVSSTMVQQNEHFHKLWTDEYVLAMPVGHPLSLQKAVSLQQIDGLPFISRTFCDAIESWNFAIQKQGITVNTKATFSTEEYALDLVAAGLGISLIPSHSTALRPDIVTRKVKDIRLERIVGLACRIDQPLPAQFLTILEQFEDHYEGQ